MTTVPRKRELSSDFHDVEVGIKRLKVPMQEVTSLNSNPYPDNFYIGKAIADGSCFFDSFRQGLEQQRGIKVTVEKLRNDCKEFARDDLPEWFIGGIANSYNNNGQHRSETVDAYTVNIMHNERWGDPDIEGRILCKKYGVKLHVIEKHGEVWGDQIVNESKSKSVNDVNYDEADTIHIINEGHAHFEPLLDKNKSLAKQLQEEAKLKQEDFLLAKKLQIEEILEYCNISKDSPERAKVEERFDKLLAKNAGGKISDVVGQCVSDIKQYIQRSEEQNSLPSCGIEEPRVTSHQQQQIPVK